MAEISWIKLSTNLPDNKKIKRIRKLPDGDKVILFWVFLLARAGESNQSGGLFLTDTMPYSDEDLAADFDFTIEFVKFALLTLEKYSMIIRYEEVLFIKNWDEYQAIEGMEKVREQNRIRKRQQRERERQILLSNNSESRDMSRDGHAEVTLSHATDIDKELDKEKEKERELEKKEHIVGQDFIFPNYLSENSIEAIKKGNPENYEKRVPIAYLNQVASKDFKYIEKNIKLVKARLNEGYTLDDFKKVIDKKVTEWRNTDMAKYIRPETIFGTKFDGYLNQETLKRTTNSTVHF